jgi:hypothetical protein
MTMYVQVAELPESLQGALKSVGYGRKDINIEAREQVYMADGGGEGFRAFVVLVDLATGRAERHDGSWGGANMFNPRNAVDLDDTPRTIIPGMAVVKGHIGGDRPVGATVYINPENVAKLLPAKPDVSDREKQLLGVMGYKSGYRKEELARMRATDAEIDALVSRGFLSRNKAGAISLTTEGKNARR